MGARVLIVEDDLVLAASVASMLRHEGFDTTLAHNEDAATASLADHAPDFVVLEPRLPHSAGQRLLNILRRDRPDLPVVMLTARANTLPQSADGTSGAPAAHLQHALPRVRAALLRVTRPANLPEALVRGGIYLDCARRECRVDGHPVFLPPKEFALLAYLMRNAGRACSREEILAAVWRRKPEFTRVVDVHVRWLRTLIEEPPSSPRRLLTVRRVGYLFTGE